MNLFQFLFRYLPRLVALASRPMTRNERRTARRERNERLMAWRERGDVGASARYDGPRDAGRRRPDPERLCRGWRKARAA